MRWTAIVLAVLVTIVGLLVLGLAPEKGEGERVAQSGSHPAEQLYMRMCASCHGRDLKGGIGPTLVTNAWKQGGDDASLTKSISVGSPKAGMPGFGTLLSDAQIADMVDYIKSFNAPAEPAQDPGSAAPGSFPATGSLHTAEYEVRVERVAERGLREPAAIAFLDARRALVAEKGGTLRMMLDGKVAPQPVKGTPPVVALGEGGLLDVAFDPDFAGGSGWVYLCYAGAEGNSSTTKLVRGKIADNAWGEQQTLFEATSQTSRPGGAHYGGRIAFDADKYLYLSVGDWGAAADAQDSGRPNGKVLRMSREGVAVPLNPFAKDADPAVYASGLRDPQGLAYDPVAGTLWVADRGAGGGDALLRVVAGAKFGWPAPAGDAAGAEPAKRWSPSIAVSSLACYGGDLFARWRGDLLLGGSSSQTLRRLSVEGGRVTGEETVMDQMGRVRDVVAAPDGSVYVVLNNPDRIVRLVPEAK